MINRIRHYIENTPWDEWVIENDRYLEIFCFVLSIAGALSFGIVVISELVRIGG